ncbi:TPA: hypothetical protein DDZ86_03715 [Candidatus Dependentiae bacterium]|nr:MAG: Calcium-translocating P-type ATPase, PMCA-type [candidate division TM6 bacterium GW2011_GWF2_43_87]HBL98723.1 hypothetical protein [Candidatus Dependentiae bacterium]
MNEWSQSVKEFLTEKKINIKNGLSSEEVRLRQSRFGINELPYKKPRGLFHLLINQLNNAFSILLFCAALLKFFAEGYGDAFFILFVIMAGAFVSALQEGKATQLVEKLRQFVKTHSIVIRDGIKQVVDQADLVPGDIIVLQEGNRVPADARLLESAFLKTDESALTGESVLVVKDADASVPQNAPIFDQKNMVFLGTTVMTGHGLAVVTSIGMQTQIGKMHAPLAAPEADMPLKRDLNRLSHYLLVVVLVITFFFILLGVLLGKDLHELLFTMTSLLVSIVPEGIPVVSTIIMARNAYLMAQNNVLVKKLQAIDALGRMQVLVVDKTGTLTKNEQMISAVLVGNKRYTVTGSGYQLKNVENVEKLEKAEGSIFSDDGEPVEFKENSPLKNMGLLSALLDESHITVDPLTSRIIVRGEPLQAALGVFALKAGFDRDSVHHSYSKLDEIPFDAQTRLHHVLFKTPQSTSLLVVMGSPELVTEHCTKIPDGLQKNFKILLKEGIRTLAIAYREDDSLDMIPPLINGLSLAGIVGMQDAIRSDAPASIARIQKMGVRVVVATGDHRETALYVARAAGLADSPDAIIEGRDLPSISQNDLMHATVLARVTPQDKLAIVDAYHQAGLFVGMTGDGVNDVPALVRADVGIAMGIIGTDVAKEAADIVLLDDTLSSISSGILLGRHALMVMRRVLIFMLATSGGEVLTIAFSLILNLPLPLMATQILWVHLLTDAFLVIALGMEPPDDQALKKSAASIKLIDWSFARTFLVTSFPIAVGTLSLFWWYSLENLFKARCIALTVLAMFQWWNAWNCRSETKSLFSISCFSNRWLLLLTGAVITAQATALYIPFLQHLLYTTPLSITDLLLCLVVSSTVFWTEEIRKVLQRRRELAA